MLLPPIQQTETLIRKAASLYDRLSNELGTRPLVLPNADFFPDVFSADAPSTTRLLRRMQAHAGMNDVPVEVRILGSDGCDNCTGDCTGDCHGSDGHSGTCSHKAGAEKQASCSSGSCGSCGPSLPSSHNDEPRLVDTGDGWRMQIPAEELSHGVVLTSNMARGLGLVFLLDTSSPEAVIAEPLDEAAELAAVALGFGGLLLSASYLYSKSCGGPRVAQGTKHNCGELAILTALFAARGHHKLRDLRRVLGTTQASALDEAESLLKDNPLIGSGLRQDPKKLADGHFELRTDVSLWRRWFGNKSQKSAAPDDLNLQEFEQALAADLASKAQRTKKVKVPQDDLKNLVEEALLENSGDLHSIEGRE